MKIKSNKEVYIRAFEPYRRNDNIKGVLNSGFEIEVDEVEGQDIDGNSKWYKDKNGDYYWSGGFEKGGQEEPAINVEGISFQKELWKRYDRDRQTLLSKINYSELLQLDDNIKKTLGKKAVVGILDHGINTKHESINNFANPLEFNSLLINSHGSFIAGLIAGNGLIKGIAPKSQILELPIYKVKDENSRRESVMKRLQRIQEVDHPVVLNVSQDLVSDNVVGLFSELPENIIVVAAAGTDSELLNTISQVPANIKQVISVGSITERFDLSKKDSISDQVDVIVPEFQFVSASKNGESGYIHGSGDSYACAIVSSICALLIAKYLPLGTISSAFIKNKLKDISSPITKIKTKSLTLLNHKK